MSNTDTAYAILAAPEGTPPGAAGWRTVFETWSPILVVGEWNRIAQEPEPGDTYRIVKRTTVEVPWEPR